MKATVVIPYASHLQPEQELAELIPIHPNISERTKTNYKTHAVAFLSTPHKHVNTYQHTHILLLVDARSRLVVFRDFGLLKLHQPEVVIKACYLELFVVSYSTSVSTCGVSPACQQGRDRRQGLPGLRLFTDVVSALLLSNHLCSLFMFAEIWVIIVSSAKRAGCEMFSLA